MSKQALFVVEPFHTATELTERSQLPEALWEGEVNRSSPEFVRWVQTSLNKILGLRLAVDGIVGPATRSAIRNFQGQRGLTVDGIVGPQTEAALRTALGGATSTSAATASRPPGRRCEVLDNFDFDRDQLKPEHRAKLTALARILIRSQRARQPIRSVAVVGHTDPVGSDAYNFALGSRRAKQVADELRRTLESIRPGSSRRITITTGSAGEKSPIAGSAAQNRRVELCYAAPRPARRIPPDHALCGVPRQANEVELAMEVQELEQEAATVTVRARLSIYQNASTTSHRNHFNCQATRWAKRIGAVAAPDAANCRRRVGSTPYDSGADIIRAIAAAQQCLRQRVDSVHVFSHSGSHGLFGTTTGSIGLYSGPVDASSRSSGARTVTDIPTTALANNVVFVLHGCNAAAGSANFAQALYQHLAASLTNPRVFGHHNSGCAGRDNSWREYSNAAPTGRNVRSIAPHYSGDGCCSKS
jgi:outer membrane protein OmpA-like peptidoglycan-associated protein